ncbi:MAG: ABC transporter ATP-binding protein [Anaerolineales bacterium]|nr:ABC transporter ATP-binding protein [Anaerolineales bacterium]MCB8954474.1 ABC transporter ATP-binding protein [Ardenticatenales bacterium]
MFKSERKEVPALQDVSLEIKPGEVFGLLGPNGAGKTTLIKCLTTLLLPSGGAAWINGYQLTRDDNAIRASVGCMLMGERGLYWKLTGRENLIFFGALYHLSPNQRKKRADDIIERLSLGEYADRAVETYSSGQKMKLAFGKALINDAPILVLDEPTNTLDVPSARELRATVRALNQEGKTIIYTTHIMAEAETLCHRVAIIDHGRVIALGDVPALKQSLQRDNIIRLEGVISNEAMRAVRQLPGINHVALAAANGHTQMTVVAANQAVILPRLVETLGSHGAVLQKITPEEVTLEDVFIAHTGRTLADDTRKK